MTRIEKTIDIDRSPEEVFEVLSDLDRLPYWATVVVENHDTPDKPLSVGDTFRQTVRVAGQNLETDWKVTEVERPKRVAYEASASGGGQLTMRQMVSARGGGRSVELKIDYELPGGFLGELLDRAYVERRNEREAEHSLSNLKELLEGRR